MTIMVREETHADLARIRQVNDLAFGRPHEGQIVDAIRARGGAILSLVAVENERIVGHIFFSPVRIEAAGETINAVGLGPVAVLPASQNRGIGSDLCRTGLARLGERGHKIVVVLGHAGYYPRFGFEQASKYGIQCQWEVPPPAFMIIALKKGALDGVRGTAYYSPEFDEG